MVSAIEMRQYSKSTASRSVRAQVRRSGRRRRRRSGVSSRTRRREEDHPARPFTRVHFLFPRPFVFAKLLHFNERGGEGGREGGREGRRRGEARGERGAISR